MCENKLKLCIYLQVQKLIYMEPRKNSRTEKYDKLFCEHSPATHSFIVNKNPTDATVCRYLFTAKLLYMFRVSQHPSSGVSKTVPAASGTGHTTCTATPLQRGLIETGLCESHATRTNQSRSPHEI